MSFMHMLFEHRRLRRIMMMSALLALLIAASAASVFAAPADTPEPLRLRAHIEIQDATLRFGDVFSNAGPLAKTVLGLAPAPGRRISLDPGWLAARTRALGRQWQNPAGLKRVSISRAGRVISSDRLRALVGKELARRSNGEAFDIALANRAQAFYAPAQASDDPRLMSLDFDPDNGVFSARINLYAGARPAQVRGRAWALQSVPALTRPMRVGDIVAPGDIHLIKMRQARLRPDTILAIDDLKGLAARRSVRADTPLRRADFKHPAAIKKGEILTVVYTVPGLRLTAQARALADAALGEPLRAVNLKTSRTIDVVVIAPGYASVGAASARVGG